MSLMLHRGAQEIDFAGLCALETPEATATHVPIPHDHLVKIVRHTLDFYGHKVVSEAHGVTDDNSRYFGVMMLKSEHGGYEDTVGIRNSHDKSFPVGISFGSKVFVCDNLAFSGDQVIKRKHTAKLKRDLMGLVTEMIEPLTDARKAQQEAFARYRLHILSDQMADHAIMEMFRRGVINVQRIADVWKEWEHPTFENLSFQHNAWRLFNAVTFVLQGKILANPSSTQNLHNIIDGVCEAV